LFGQLSYTYPLRSHAPGFNVDQNIKKYNNTTNNNNNETSIYKAQ